MAVPEFVSGIIMLTIFGIWLHWLPTTSVSAGGNPSTTPQYLVLPVLALGLVFFGYVSRMMRASTITVLGSADMRTAMLKGLPMRLVLMRHVLRNALVPTITVVMSSIGYLVGGLVVVENLFGYPGLGSLLLYAGLHHDVPLLEDCVMIIAVMYMVGNLVADLLGRVPEPARSGSRHKGAVAMSVQRTVSLDGGGSAPVAPESREAPSIATLPARRSQWRSALRTALRTPSAAVGLCVVVFWVVCAIFWPLFAPDDPDAQDLLRCSRSPRRRTSSGPMNWGAMSSAACSRAAAKYCC